MKYSYISRSVYVGNAISLFYLKTDLLEYPPGENIVRGHVWRNCSRLLPYNDLIGWHQANPLQIIKDRDKTSN